MSTDAARIDRNKRLVRRLHESVWSGGDLDAVGDLLARGYVEHHPLAADDVQGRGAFERQVSAYRAAFSGFEHATLDVIAEGNVVVVRHAWRGTHTGPFLGIDPTGRSINVPGVAVHHVDGGRVTKTWSCLDSLGLLVQLDATARPWTTE